VRKFAVRFGSTAISVMFFMSLFMATPNYISSKPAYELLFGGLTAGALNELNVRIGRWESRNPSRGNEDESDNDNDFSESGSELVNNDVVIDIPASNQGAREYLRDTAVRNLTGLIINSASSSEADGVPPLGADSDGWQDYTT